MKNNKKKNGRGRKANKLNSRIVFFSLLTPSYQPASWLSLFLILCWFSFFFFLSLFFFLIYEYGNEFVFFLLLQPKRCYSPVPGLMIMMMMIATVCWKTFMCCCQDCSRHLETPCTIAGVLDHPPYYFFWRLETFHPVTPVSDII